MGLLVTTTGWLMMDLPAFCTGESLKAKSQRGIVRSPISSRR